MPPHVDERAAFEAITHGKDVDGVTMASFAAMSVGGPGFHSCTPAGIMHLLDANDIDPTGSHAVVIGRSPILGRPVGMVLSPETPPSPLATHELSTCRGSSRTPTSSSPPSANPN